MGFVGIGTMLVATGALIQLFDLEEGADLSKTQEIAGYFVIVFVCLQMSVYALSYA